MDGSATGALTADAGRQHWSGVGTQPNAEAPPADGHDLAAALSSCHSRLHRPEFGTHNIYRVDGTAAFDGVIEGGADVGVTSDLASLDGMDAARHKRRRTRDFDAAHERSFKVTRGTV